MFRTGNNRIIKNLKIGSVQLFAVTMDEKALLTQCFMIRYTSLLSILKDKMAMTDEGVQQLEQQLLRVDWFDNVLNKIQALPRR